MPERKLKVFLCHASQDKALVHELYLKLAKKAWIEPWLDAKKLLPGQNWQAEILNAVETADNVIIFLSNTTINKDGFVQKELRYAKDISELKSEESIFLIPLRLDNCDVPQKLQIYQWANYFGEEKEQSFNNLLTALKFRHEQLLEKESVLKGVGDQGQRKNVNGIDLKEIFNWINKKNAGIILFFIFIFVSVFYALTVTETIPDCCGLIPTKTPTATLTATPSQTPKFTDTPATIFTPTFTSSPTETSTFTPSPTPTITFTPTQTPNPIIFKGFDRNCIDPDYWTPHVYPGEKEIEKNANGCLNLLSRGISAQGNGLRINLDRVGFSVFSIATELSGNDLEIRFKVTFNSFTSTSQDTAAVLAFGVGPSDDWAMKNGYYLAYMIPEGSSNNEIYEQTGTSRIKREHLLHRFYTPKDISVRLIIRGIDLRMYSGKDTYNFFPVSLAELDDKYHFWIGYQLPPGKSTLDATITEFSVTEIK